MTEVHVLTAPGCHWCDEAQAILASLSREFDLRVTLSPAETDEGRALAFANGALFPPIIFVDGVFVQYGRPSAKKLRAVLGASAARVGVR